MDVPDPEGRQVPQRPDDDGEGRRREHEAVRRRKGSNAGLTPFFDPAGVSAKGNYTVVFRLKSPIGVFPYLVSQTTYQAIIQPAAIAAKPGTWVKSGMIGTGAFKLMNYVDKKSATLVRNAAYWGGRPPLDGVKITFYQGSAPMVLALRAGQIDLAMQLSPQEGAAVQEQLEVQVLRAADLGAPPGLHANRPGPAQGCARSSGGRARDQPARSRLAKIMLGAGQVGNDSPFWKGFASTDPSIKQRTQNLAAREGAAGGGGCGEPEVQPHDVELPRPRRTMPRRSRRTRSEAGIDIGIEVMDVGKYYDSEPAGADYATTTPWLNRTCTLTEYGARGVPNIFLTRAYMSTG